MLSQPGFLNLGLKVKIWWLCFGGSRRQGVGKETLKAPLVGLKVAKLIRQVVFHTSVLSPQRAHPPLPAHLLTQLARGADRAAMVRWGGGVVLGALWLPVLRELCLMPGLCVSLVGRAPLIFLGLRGTWRDLEGVLLPLQWGFLFTAEPPACIGILDIVDAQ